MRVKRYVVDTLPDALNKIRQELGNDAVILNTKQLKVGGFLGMFSKKKIEVIAAIDNTSSSGNKQQASLAVAAAQKEVAAVQKEVAGAQKEVPEHKETAGATMPNALAARMYRSTVGATNQVDPEASASRPAAPTAVIDTLPEEHTPSNSISTGVRGAHTSADVEPNPIEKFKRAAAKSIQDAAARPSGLKHTEPQASSPGEAQLDQQALLAEIKEMKALVAKLSDGMQSSETNDETAPAANPFQTLEGRLADQGIMPSIIEDLKKQTQLAIGVDQSVHAVSEAKRLMRAQMIKLLERAPASGISESSRILQFVGPTGVGKTTTIAKLAAEQVLKHNQKVGFITSDTYRIAAIDQLKTYATILNVPVEVVFSPDEMEGALARLSNCSLIFMDTAGRNYREENSVEDLIQLLGEHGETETYLVLSLVAKYQDIRAIVDNFKRFKVDKVLWTKMDETLSFGSIVNLMDEYALPLSYITNGQNVPDDISLLDPHTIADLILGEDAYD